MISAWWLIPAVMVGAAIGFAAHAMLTVAKDN